MPSIKKRIPSKYTASRTSSADMGGLASDRAREGLHEALLEQLDVVTKRVPCTSVCVAWWFWCRTCSEIKPQGLAERRRLKCLRYGSPGTMHGVPCWRRAGQTCHTVPLGKAYHACESLPDLLARLMPLSARVRHRMYIVHSSFIGLQCHKRRLHNS